MKITKTFVLLLTVILLMQMATACGDTPTAPQTNDTLNSTESHEVVQLDNYPIFVYQNAVGTQGDTVTSQYTGEDYYAQDNYSKANSSTKQINMSGDKLNLFYTKSTKLNMYKDDLDVYETSYEDRLLRIEYNVTTGKIVRYIRYAPCVDREYTSDVSPKSSKEDYIAYVKKILFEQAGVSVDDREVKISTKIIKENGSPEYASSFVNNSEVDQNFNAEYTFEFCSNIDGISRADDIVITVTNVGEICSITALSNDDAYAPFENIKIDKTLINNKVEEAFLNVKGLYDVKSYKITLQCLPVDSGLWVEALVEYSYQVDGQMLTSGVIYLIKVAELK